MIPARPFLCVITDETASPEFIAEQALRGGAGMIQLRRKQASGSELYGWACRLQELCRHHGALFIVNDRTDIALAARADGVHLGQEDLPLAEARRLLGPEAIIGISTASIEEAQEAERNGADYIGFGHLYPTGSKEKRTPPVGLGELQRVAASVSIPVVAIGGITLQTAPAVIAGGASGIAVISAVTGAPEPAKAARALREAMQEGNA